MFFINNSGQLLFFRLNCKEFFCTLLRFYIQSSK